MKLHKKETPKKKISTAWRIPSKFQLIEDNLVTSRKPPFPGTKDGWVEGPTAHGPFSQSNKEDDYFMQVIHPVKRHRVAMMTPLGYRLTYGLGDDIWNSDIGINIYDEPEISEDFNYRLVLLLQSREYIDEMKKFTGHWLSQGECILHLLFNEDIWNNPDILETEISENEEILKVEAYNKINYNIIKWDEYGDPEYYTIRMRNEQGSVVNQRVHASRVMRFTDKNLYKKEEGWARLNVVYNEILIVTNIIKAAGEAAFRWGTGHPFILTKNITEADEIQVIKDAIGVPTRRSWHILPEEYISKFEMIGQAGQMLNLKALNDMVLEQIASGYKVPMSVVTGSAQISEGQIEDRDFYGALDQFHQTFEPFVRAYFARDINTRKLFKVIEDEGLKWDLDWGVRLALSKMDQIEYRQREISNSLAMSSLCTINECRREIGFGPLPDMRGEIILSIGPPPGMEEQSPADEANNYEQEAKSTSDQSLRGKDLEKDKTIQTGGVKLRENKAKVKDAIIALRDSLSMEEISEIFGISKNTLYKIIENLDEG